MEKIKIIVSSIVGARDEDDVVDATNDLLALISQERERLLEETEDKIRENFRKLPIEIVRKGDMYYQGMHAMHELVINTIIEQRKALSDIGGGKCKGCGGTDRCYCGATVNEPHSGFDAVA